MHIRVPPERVFEALDTNQGRASFWAESAVESDGKIEFQFANGFRFSGRVLQRNSPDRYAIEYFGGPVRFELAPDGSDGTDLLLTHEGVSDESWQEVHAGWLNVLFPLKAWLEHDVDLRNHDPKRSWDQGYADQ